MQLQLTRSVFLRGASLLGALSASFAAAFPEPPAIPAPRPKIGVRPPLTPAQYERRRRKHKAQRRARAITRFHS